MNADVRCHSITDDIRDDTMLIGPHEETNIETDCRCQSIAVSDDMDSRCHSIADDIPQEADARCCSIAEELSLENGLVASNVLAPDSTTGYKDEYEMKAITQEHGDHAEDFFRTSYA